MEKLNWVKGDCAVVRGDDICGNHSFAEASFCRHSKFLRTCQPSSERVRSASSPAGIRADPGVSPHRLPHQLPLQHILRLFLFFQGHIFPLAGNSHSWTLWFCWVPPFTFRGVGRGLGTARSCPAFAATSTWSCRSKCYTQWRFKERNSFFCWRQPADSLWPQWKPDHFLQYQSNLDLNSKAAEVSTGSFWACWLRGQQELRPPGRGESTRARRRRKKQNPQSCNRKMFLLNSEL